MDLPNGGCSKGTGVETGKALMPARAPILGENALQLLGRHSVGLGAQSGQNIRDFARQHLAAIHRQKLTQLHRCAAHAREFLGQPRRIGRGQRERGKVRSPPRKRLAPRAKRYARGNAASSSAHTSKTRKAALGDRARGGRLCHLLGKVTRAA